MDFDLRHYVRLYEGFLDPPMLNFALSELETIAEWQGHQFYDSQTGALTTTENELSVSYSNMNIKEILNKKIWFALERYILKDFQNFNWWQKWNGYSPVRFNKYSENTDMKLHCDHIHSLFEGERKGIPVLSIVGLLNDDFEGGEFIMWDNEVIPMSAGSILVFPSNFMYPHRVNPVTKGTRYSFVSWSW
jgi:hypothetical protein